MNLHQKKSISLLVTCVLLIILPLSSMLIKSARGARINTRQVGDINVAVITANSSSEYLQGYKIALELDPIYNTTYFTPANLSAFNIVDPTATSQPFDVVFLLDLGTSMNLTIDQVQNLTWAVDNGTIGLFYQTNNAKQPYNTILLPILEEVLPLRIELTGDNGTELEIDETTLVNTRVMSVSDVLLSKIGFISMPLLENLSITVANHTSSKTLVEGTLGLTGGSAGDPLLATLDDPSRKVIQLSAPLRRDSNENFGNWPYFNYFIYVSILKLAGVPENEIKSFGNWPFSPIPKNSGEEVIILILVCFGILTFLLYYYFRNKTKKKPLELLPEIPARKKTKKKKKKTRIEQDGKEPGPEDQSVVAPDDIVDIKTKSWKIPGYHKPLSGFYLMFYILVAIVPLFVLLIFFIPTFIIQDPSSFGIQFIISSIFSAVFITLDFGLAQAYDRFVGQYWSVDPTRALKYIQFFIWYQMISGLAQTTIISLIGLYWIPQVHSVAFMSWFFIVNTLIQFPGIAYVFSHLLKSAQRTDLDATVGLISLLVQIGLMAVLPEVFRSIGATNPLIGEVIGASIGLSLGSYLGQLAHMFLSAFFIKKIDRRFKFSQIFRIDFDGKLIKETIWFGLKSMLSNVIFLVGNFISVLIITFKLNNYTYYGSFIGIATYITYPIYFMTVLYDNALPTTSEAYNNKKYKLTQSFITYGFKYFGMYTLLLFTLFVMPFSVNKVLSSFVEDLFKPIGFIAMCYSITKLFYTIGDFSKFFLISIDRVGTYIYAVLVEQSVRITFLIFTIDSLQIYAFLFAEVPGLIVKVLITWIFTHKKILKVKINKWQTFIAPGISSAMIAGIAWFLSLFFNDFQAFLTPLGASLLYAVIFFPGFTFFLYPFLLGALGGHDDEVLKQIEFAAKHCGPSKIFAITFYHMTSIGCKISPLHNRYPIDYSEAEKEAEELLTINSK
ncbi:MAG: lipopolysaccharide biosynthesis protein [Candidatus Hodarchaeota archaeon]